MLEAPGVGLAAPRSVSGLRVFTYYVDDELGHLVNPSLDLSDEEQDGDEGCLSFPGLSFPCVRACGVVAKGFDMHGEPVTVEGTELLARCVQHETDHLDGVLFIDRLDRGPAQAGDEGDPRGRMDGRDRARPVKVSPAPPCGPGALSSGAPCGASPVPPRSRSRRWTRCWPPATRSSPCSPGPTRRPDGAAGSASPVAARAASAGIEMLKPERLRDPDLLRPAAPTWRRTAARSWPTAR